SVCSTEVPCRGRRGGERDLTASARSGKLVRAGADGIHATAGSTRANQRARWDADWVHFGKDDGGRGGDTEPCRVRGIPKAGRRASAAGRTAAAVCGIGRKSCLSRGARVQSWGHRVL